MNIKNKIAKAILAGFIGIFACATMQADRIKITNNIPDVDNRDDDLYVAIYVKSKGMIKRKGKVKKVDNGKSIKINHPKEDFELAIVPENDKKLLMKEFEIGSEEYMNLKRVNVASTESKVIIDIRDNSAEKITKGNLKIMVE